MSAKLAKFLQSGTDEERAEERREARITRIWSRIFVVVGSLFLLALTAMAALVQHMSWEFRSEVYDSDGPPTTAQRSEFKKLGYPDSIYRVREVGAYRHGIESGEKLTICCVALQDVPELKKVLGTNVEWEHAEWAPGFPENVRWRETIHAGAPPDLAIPNGADAKDFIHLLVRNDSVREEWSLLDLKRGICYQRSYSTH